MDYSKAPKRFNIQTHVKGLHGLSLSEMISATGLESRTAEKISIPQRTAYKIDVENLKTQYVENLKELGFFLCNFIKPAGVKPHVFMLFKPLIQELAEKEELKPSVLELFNNSQ